MVAIVDYATSDAKLAAALDASFEEHSFAILRDHPLTSSQMNSMFRGCAEFFSLPLERKLECSWRRDDAWRGYFPIDPDPSGEQVERLEYGRENMQSSDQVGAAEWPSAPAGLSPTWRTYYAEMESLVTRLLGVTSAAGFFDGSHLSAWADRHDSNLAANYYLAPDRDPIGTGMKPHTDFGGFTILASDASWPRLECERGRGQWAVVDLSPYDLLVQAGDLLSGLLGRRWKPLNHRVSYADPPMGEVVDHRRVSVVYFHVPDRETSLPVAMRSIHATTVGEYMQHRMAAY